ncbi:MAG: DUF4221 domain-containing protein [Bacteroidales bacterium]|nr:DUF4221 domain-containing protein [Bacteroidales bacterium]
MKQLYYYLSLIIIILFLSSCTKKEITITKTNKEKIIKLGYQGGKGTYYDNVLKKTVFTYVNVESENRMDLFDEDFNHIQTININPKIPYLFNALVLVPFAHDSIIALIKAPSFCKAYVLNFKGEIIREVFHKEWFDKYSDVFLLVPFYGVNQSYSNGKFYVGYKVARNRDKYYYKGDYSQGYVPYIDSLILNSGCIASFDLDSLNVTQHLKNVYKENYKKGDFIPEYPYYFIQHDKVFVPIPHNGRVYVYDTKKDTIVKDFYIKSKYGKIGMDTVFKHDKDRVPDFFKTRSISGKILSIAWDRYRKLYYFTLVPSGKDIEKLNFIIQVYDEDFDLRGETIGGKVRNYRAGNLKVNKEGLWINHNNPYGDNYERGVEKYNLFTIDD